MNELQEQISRQEVNAEEIESYREQIDSLQSENSRLSENINTLQQHIAEYTSKLDKARRDTEKFRSISEENLNLSRVLDDMEWETLEQMCESTYGNFVSRLQSICPTLTKQELHLCILIKLRFSNSQMSEIFGVSVSSVSQKKFRLKKHLSDSLEGGLPEDMTLDRWVAEF